MKKVFFGILSVVLLLSCGEPQSLPIADKPAGDTLPSEPNLTFGSPLPREFEAEVSQVHFIDGQITFSTKYLIARSDSNLLIVSDYGKEDERAILRLAEGKAYHVEKRSRTYKPAPDDLESIDDESVASLIGVIISVFDAAKAKIEMVSFVDGIAQYSVELPGQKDVKRFHYFDEELQRTIRQETRVTNDVGEQFTRIDILRYETETSGSRFKIPHHYRQVDK
ncbi:MAG TPA: hypothetical protein VMM38_04275 [Aridibacter sp.]|nr:hypothetical protein [Aridibacter sp.]